MKMLPILLDVQTKVNRPGFSSVAGICFFVQSEIDDEGGQDAAQEWLDVHFRLCSMYSGDIMYPVPHPEIASAKDAYQDTSDVWAGEYGENRRAMLQEVIDMARKEEERD